LKLYERANFLASNNKELIEKARGGIKEAKAFLNPHVKEDTEMKNEEGIVKDHE
jgi:hypothetical protein